MNNINNQMLPHSLEAEQSILGSLMIDNNLWNKIYIKINIYDFFNKKHKCIFEYMHKLIELKKPIDLITLSEALEQEGKLKIIGGIAYLAELSKNISSTVNIIEYANIIHEKAILREVIQITSEINSLCYNPGKLNIEELLNIAANKIVNLINKKQNIFFGPKPLKNIVKNTLFKLKANYKTKKKSDLTGISYGYKDLDIKTSGLQNSELIILAARPSMGKTSLAINICENILLKENLPILFFSLEMSAEQVLLKIISSLSNTTVLDIKSSKLKLNNFKHINNIIKILLKKDKMLFIDDSSELTTNDLRIKARRLYKENNGLSLIIIDYLQLMRVPNLAFNRTLEITEISRTLKSLAKELDIPVLALSQLNRSLELRNNKRPINSDLRESGSIEQDADLILFIYRDELYNKNSNMKGIAEILIGKHRNGPLGNIKLYFNEKNTKFYNYN